MRILARLITASCAGALACGCVTIEDTVRRDTRYGILSMAAAFSESEGARGRAAAVEASLSRVRAALKDPDSAQFQNIGVVPLPSGAVICGDLNARNGYGGYTGFSPFVASPSRAILRRDSADAAVRGMNWAIFDACELGTSAF
jgi:hypothetical protein